MKLSDMRNSAGRLPDYAWPGGYPIVYVMADGECLCPDCANGENGSEASETAEDPGWRLDGCEVHYEGPPITCAHCGKEIESAYGDPDEDTNREPADDDIIVSDCGPLGGLSQAHYAGKRIAGPCPDDEIDAVIRDWMTKNSYWPEVWTQDDHGGYCLRDIRA